MPEALMRLVMMGVLRAPEGDGAGGGAGGTEEELEDVEADLEVDDGGEPDDADPPPPPARKVTTLPTAAVAKIRAQAKAAGLREARAALDQEAQDQGFASHAAMVQQAVRSKKSGGTPSKEAQAEIAALKEENVKLVRRCERLEADRRRLALRASNETKLRKRADHKRNATEAEMELAIAATKAGIRDVDYSIQLLRRHVTGKDPKFLEKFDEMKFFSGLKSTHPYLFQGETVKAGTVPGADATPDPKGVPGTEHVPGGVEEPGAAPIPGAAGGAGGAGGAGPKPEVKDAREMTQMEYQKLLASHGLTAPGGSLPI